MTDDNKTPTPSEEQEKQSSPVEEPVVLEDSSDEGSEEMVLEQRKRRITFSPLTFLFGGVILAILLALLVHFVITPIYANNAAQSGLDDLKSSSGPVTPVNTSLVTFQGQKIENANVAQKALGVGDTATTPAGFIFSNGKGAKGARMVDVYVDFGNQRSRDFLLMNQNLLRGMVENGSIQLRVHPVPTGNAFTMYSSEAIAESFITSPESSWDFMLELMRLPAVVKTDSAADVLKSIVDTAKEVGVKDVDGESIKNGTFSSWIISVGNDSRLKTGYYPPLVYVNDQILDSSKINLNDSDTLRREILKR